MRGQSNGRRNDPALRTTCAGLAAAVLAWTPAARAADTPPDYHPSMGDLMTMTVQPRHIKLGLGGKARNWEYAAYEVSELQNAFKRVLLLNPTYRKQDMNALFSANMQDPLNKLVAAIKAKNAKGFDAGYASVTHSCNTCHEGLEHPFVVIKEPTSSTFPDQVFGKAKTVK